MLPPSSARCSSRFSARYSSRASAAAGLERARAPPRPLACSRCANPAPRSPACAARADARAPPSRGAGSYSVTASCASSSRSLAELPLARHARLQVAREHAALLFRKVATRVGALFELDLRARELAAQQRDRELLPPRAASPRRSRPWRTPVGSKPRRPRPTSAPRTRSSRRARWRRVQEAPGRGASARGSQPARASPPTISAVVITPASSG